MHAGGSAAGPCLAMAYGTMNATIMERIRGEYLEMPGLQLTLPQAQKLWGLNAKDCRHVIDALVEASFLRWTASGRLVRAAN